MGTPNQQINFLTRVSMGVFDRTAGKRDYVSIQCVYSIHLQWHIMWIYIYIYIYAYIYMYIYSISLLDIIWYNIVWRCTHTAPVKTTRGLIKKKTRWCSRTELLQGNMSSLRTTSNMVSLDLGIPHIQNIYRFITRTRKHICNIWFCHHLSCITIVVITTI